SVPPAMAFPNVSMPKIEAAEAQPVQYRHHGGGHGHGVYYGHGGYYGHGHHGSNNGCASIPPMIAPAASPPSHQAQPL
ncbi:hypothetical protein ACC758_39680, partial [Rhizobium ruizarguesonis]